MGADHDSNAVDSLAARTMTALLASVARADRRQFVSFIGGGIGVDPERLELLARADPQNDAWLSKIANVIPSLVDLWSDQLPAFEPYYRAWLERASVPDSSLSHEEAAIFTDALGTVFKWGHAYHAAEQRLRDLTLQLEAARRTHRELRVLLELKNAGARAMQDWQSRGRKARYETARAYVTQYLPRGQSLMRAHLRALAEQQTLYCPVTPLLPGPLDAMAWARCSVPRDLGSTPLAPNLPAWPGLWIRKRQGTPTPLEIDTRAWQLSCEWLRVRLDRSTWFDPALLQSRDWWWPGATRTHPLAGGPLFSDGAPAPMTQGVWPLIATELLLARDVVIEAPDERLLTRFLERAQLEDEAGVSLFGCRSARPTTLSRAFDLERESGSRVRVRQLQISALVCESLRAAPNPDPRWLPA